MVQWNDSKLFYTATLIWLQGLYFQGALMTSSSHLKKSMSLTGKISHLLAPQLIAHPGHSVHISDGLKNRSFFLFLHSQTRLYIIKLQWNLSLLYIKPFSYLSSHFSRYTFYPVLPRHWGLHLPTFSLQIKDFLFQWIVAQVFQKCHYIYIFTFEKQVPLDELHSPFLST